MISRLSGFLRKRQALKSKDDYEDWREHESDSRVLQERHIITWKRKMSRLSIGGQSKIEVRKYRCQNAITSDYLAALKILKVIAGKS